MKFCTSIIEIQIFMEHHFRSHDFITFFFLCVKKIAWVGSNCRVGWFTPIQQLIFYGLVNLIFRWIENGIWNKFVFSIVYMYGNVAISTPYICVCMFNYSKAFGVLDTKELLISFPMKIFYHWNCSSLYSWKSWSKWNQVSSKFIRSAYSMRMKQPIWTQHCQNTRE